VHHDLVSGLARSPYYPAFSKPFLSLPLLSDEGFLGDGVGRHETFDIDDQA
jgi:hypothetical protein